MKYSLTDTMVQVPDMNTAIEFWVNNLGMQVVQTSPDWSMLQDPETGQKIVFTGSGFGHSWAFSISTTDVQGLITQLTQKGCEVLKSIETFENGFSYAICRDTSSLPLLIYSA